MTENPNASLVRLFRIIARLNVGGPARHVVWLTAGLRAYGYETLLITGMVPPGEDDMSYIAPESDVTPLVFPEMSREISLRDLLTVWKLFRLMQREKPALVHTHTAKAGTVGRVAGFMYRCFSRGRQQCRFVHTYHGHVFHSYYGPLKTKLFLAVERCLARLVTDRIVVISEQQRHEINEVFQVGKPEQFAVIPLGIDLDLYRGFKARRSRLRAELESSDEEVLVGIIGRLTGVKNHTLFLEAAALVRVPGPAKPHFVIVGDGSLRKDLEETTRALGLTEAVSFLGTRDDPQDFYPGLDIVALSSSNEGTPLTIIEAMANARPVIATNVGGVVDLLGPVKSTHAGYAVCERGILVQSGDTTGFAQGLERLIADEPLRDELGERGLEFVTRYYSKERLLNDIAALYSQLVLPVSDCD
jgi:glycosyltransferase involved in cell wall biosynthesis